MKERIAESECKDHSGSNTNNQNIHSELPQIALDNFEQGIKYASTMDKDGSTANANAHGEGDEAREEVTWDEAMSNLRTQLFNDLVDYVTRVPNMIYNHYCTDTLPYAVMIKSTFDYLENIAEVTKL